MRALALMLLFVVPSSSFAQAVPVSPPPDAPLATTLVPNDVPPMVETLQAPIYKRWYFWTGVGATVATLVVASVVYGVQAASMKPGYSETTICEGGRCGACIGFMCASGAR